ncbi:MAG: response regulator [Opitutae bacterium]|nr:response regulator [Opitutae bacterium]
MIWIDLIYNLALLIALSVVSGFVDMRWKRGTRPGALLQGVVFGSAAMIGMLRPFVMGPGLIFDGRSVMISLGGLFFGPGAAGVACLMTVPLRVWQGGPGAGMGVMVMLVSAGIGIGFHQSRRGKSGEFSAAELLVFGLLVHLGMLAMTVFLPAGMTLPVLKHISLPVMLIYPLATVLIGKILSDQAAQDRLLKTLREERERLAGILTGTHAGTWEWNVQTGSLVVNARWAEIMGYALAEISPGTAETWRKFTHPDDLKVRDQLLERHFRGELDYYELELRMRHKDGSWVWILDRGRVTSHTKDGKPLMMMGTHQDISARKQAEGEKARLEADLQHAQKMESVGRLAGGVAHDFNNILTVILGHAEMALEQVDPSQPIRHDLKEIHKAAQRSADLTRQLLAFARKQTVAPRVLDLNQTIGGMRHMLQRLLGEGIDLSWGPQEGLWPVKVDPSQVDQILVNLCANARDSIAGIGQIVIGAENVAFDEAACAGRAGFLPGEFVRLSVEDNGSGMDRETLGHIFEPFFTTKGLGKGTGLGLPTIYGIVKQNKGFIHVRSEPGAGTVFSLHLPRHVGEAELVSADVSAPPGEGGHETILLVEDEASILRMTKEMIEQQGYAVLAASGPDVALRLAREHAGEIHLLLTDVVMPGMNGRDLAQELLKTRPDIRCLFMSGYTADLIAENGRLREGVHFIQKPFSGTELATRIRAALDS